MVLVMETRASHKLDNCYITELHPNLTNISSFECLFIYGWGGACNECNVELVLSICPDIASMNGAEIVRLCQTCFTHLVSLHMSLNIWPDDEQLDLFICFCILSTVTSQDL